MSTDPPPVAPPPASSSAPRRVLFRASDLGLRNSRERAIYRKLKTKIFAHTPVLNPTLLVEAGMADEFDIIFSLVGWTTFENITELGSKLLTIEFLCTLQLTELGVCFRLFTEEFTLTWRNLSDLLGFPSIAPIDIDAALGDFDTHRFWTAISREPYLHAHCTGDIEHPTLRFLHRWLGATFFPRDDKSKVRVADLQLMYAAVKKVKVSPVCLLVHHWLSVPNYKVGDVAICSIITRIATSLNLIKGYSLDFIGEHRDIYGFDYFSHGHLLKREKGDLFMTYGNASLRLPNPEMALYFI
jgi:hypothetical protein